MDRGQVRSEARVNIRVPQRLSRKFYYDCLTHSEAALRMVIDTGIDRVIFGTDWPADMAIDWPVSWILSLQSLTQEERSHPLQELGETLRALKEAYARH